MTTNSADYCMLIMSGCGLFIGDRNIRNVCTRNVGLLINLQEAAHHAISRKPRIQATHKSILSSTVLV